MYINRTQLNAIKVLVTMIMIIRQSFSLSFIKNQPRRYFSRNSQRNTISSSFLSSKINQPGSYCRSGSSSNSINDPNHINVYDVSEIETKIVPKNFVPFPFKYHEELTVRVSSLTNLGLGICRTNITNTTQNKEWVIMVPNVIPDELIKIRIYRNYKSYSDADLLEILEPSSHRIDTPPCMISTICGGCQYQHITIEYQRYWKQLHVYELFLKNANIDLNSLKNENHNVLHPTLGTNHIFHYRTKITPHYDVPKKKDDKTISISENDIEVFNIGFKEKMSRRIIDVPYCNIATHDINTKLKEVRENVTQSYIHHRKEEQMPNYNRNPNEKKKFNKGATLLLRKCNQANDIITDHKTYVYTNVFDYTFRYMAGNFFQNNDYMLPVMVGTTEKYAIASNKKKLNYLIDCYCGSGLFAISLNKHFEYCIGIEVNANAIEEAKYNAELNGINNCYFLAASAEAIFDASTTITNHEENSNDTTTEVINVNALPRDEVAVILDPPRKGCSVDFIQQLCNYKPQRILYMSCDPATQARDVKLLLEMSGDGYSIDHVQPFDLFPQTRHIECLTVLEKKGG